MVKKGERRRVKREEREKEELVSKKKLFLKPSSRLSILRNLFASRRRLDLCGTNKKNYAVCRFRSGYRTIFSRALYQLS